MNDLLEGNKKYFIIGGALLLLYILNPTSGMTVSTWINLILFAIALYYGMQLLKKQVGQ